MPRTLVCGAHVREAAQRAHRRASRLGRRGTDGAHPSSASVGRADRSLPPVASASCPRPARRGPSTGWASSEADDVARAALYLASDDAAWTSGTILTVDGGIMA
jgi:NAD(P)-dependent dehydrogenase (short-subunit alcohol dehydrogenase family)